MGIKLTGKALTKFEAQRNVWQEVLPMTDKSKLAEESRRRLELNHVSFVRDSECNCTLIPILPTAR